MSATFFGHPRGLATLFFTEMWERFSYYGIRALLILFMTASTDHGGLGFDVVKASAIYGLYTALNYMMCLPGGWIADRFLGQRRAVFLGGVVIAAGNFSIAVPTLASFYIGLGLIIVGTGLLKPNVSTIVGQIYAAGDVRRDSGFSIFYMGINLGAFIAPLACGYVGQRIDWHLGFALSGVGMIVGLVQYSLGGRHLGEAGLHPVKPESAAAAARQKRQLVIGLSVFAAILLALAGLSYAGILPITATRLSKGFGVILTLTVVVVFTWLLGFTPFTAVEKKRLVAVFALFLASAWFWSVFEQAGSTLTLFAERSTNNSVLGWGFPASWFQSLNSIFIFIFAPVFAWLWMKLGKSDLSSPTKFSLGLFFAAAGFAVLVPAAQAGGRVSPLWLTTTYLIHTFGELCLSPVGLSAMTKLAPARIAGMTMGLWFLSTSVGNYLGGRMAGMYESLPLPTLFGAVAGVTVVTAVIMAVFIKPINRLMGGVR